MKDNKVIKVKEAKFKDETDTIPITFFGDFTENVLNEKTYEITAVRLSKYKDYRIIKSTETTRIIESDFNIKMTEEDRVKTMTTLDGTIVAVDTKSLIKFLCPNCNYEVEDDDSVATCVKCDIMSVTEDCKKKSSVSFTIKTSDTGAKTQVQIDGDVAFTCFNEINNEMTPKGVAKMILRTNIKLVYRNNTSLTCFNVF